MIVTCERCATQFQLDDARIPEGGVRVRCSRCKHAFEVRRAAPPAPPGPAEDEESDWQFNEDPPRRDGSGRDDAASVVDDLLGKVDLEGDASAQSGLDLDGPGPQGSAVAAAPSPPRPAPPEPELDTAPAGLDLDADEPSDALGGDLAEDASEDLETDDLVGDLAGELESEFDLDHTGDLSAMPDMRTETPAHGEEAASDELSPADWDLLAGDDAPSRVVSVDPDDLVDDRPRWRSALDGAGQAVAWLGVVAVFAFGLHGGLVAQRTAAPELAPPTDVASGVPVELLGLDGRFVEHAVSGPVYVVSGRLRNAGSRPVEAGTLGLTLVDGEGRPLVPPAPVGAPLSGEAIREGEVAGPWRRSPRLSPGESRSFEVVLGALPPGAQRVRLTEVPLARVDPVEEPEAPPQADGSAGTAAAGPQATSGLAGSAADTNPPAAPAP